MSEPEFEVNNINALVDNLLSQVADANLQMLEGFANIQNRRAARLAAAEARLKADLGENHPQVVALRDRAAAADAIERSLQTMVGRTPRRPQVKENEWLVFGRVLDGEGNPVSGVRVRVFDRDRIFDDLLGATSTDEYGNFAITYCDRDFAEPTEGLPELYVMVEDNEGNQLYSSRDNIRYNSGRSEYFEIVLANP